MKEVCRFYKNGECLNPNCRFSHPLEYPMYIYTSPGIEIHPDELRLAVMANGQMAAEADSVWLENYAMFCRKPGDKLVDIVEFPDYFCTPFDADYVLNEVEKLKNSGMLNCVEEQRFQQGSSYGQRQPSFRGYDQPRNFGQQRFSNQQNSWKQDRRSFDSPRNPNSQGYSSQQNNDNPSFGRQRSFNQPQQRTFDQPQQKNYNRFQQKGFDQFNRNQGYGQSYSRQPRQFSDNPRPERQPSFSSQNYARQQPAFESNRFQRQDQPYQDANSSRESFISQSDFPNRFDRKSAPQDSAGKDFSSSNNDEDFEYQNIPYSYR